MGKKPLVIISILIAIFCLGLIFWYFNRSKIVTSVILSEVNAIEKIKNQFPELEEYPSYNLPPKSIKTEKADDGWYVAFIQEGSGRPIIDARCFLIRDNIITQHKYIPKDGTVTGKFSAKECKLIENMVGENSNAGGGSGNIVGGDEDEYGCKGSAGYSWCQEKQRCLRVWEEPCEKATDDLACGLETCHGLDVICGSNPPMACTMMYSIGDKCLQHAKCGVQNGICQQIQNTQFTECKVCVQNCLDTSNNDSVKLFNCESQCK